MKVLINGESREFGVGLDITGVVEALGLPCAGALVEHNGVALRREEWGARRVEEGDRLEIIRIVAGG